MQRIFKDYPLISLKHENSEDKIDFQHIFGRSAEVHIEVGSGKGTFLLNQSKAEPQINFLGIEWANKYHRHAVDRIGRWEIKNVRIIRADAANFITEFIPDDSVDCFHIYFPDPWPKKRHHKRRFVNPQNLDQLLRCLKHHGIIKLATDHAEYFEQVKTVLAEKKNRLEEIDFLPTAGADTGEWVGTNFERKYIKEKRPVYTIAVKKIK